jgi:hypothetical protein
MLTTLNIQNYYLVLTITQIRKLPSPLGDSEIQYRQKGKFGGEVNAEVLSVRITLEIALESKIRGTTNES